MMIMMTTLLQVDGHPVKGWDEKALLAHVMGEEGEQQQFERKPFVAETCSERRGGRNCTDALRAQARTAALSLNGREWDA